MNTARLTAAAGVLSLAALTGAGCSTASTPPPHQAAAKAAAAPSFSPPPSMQTDPNGQQCIPLDSLGYCPGDDPPTPSPLQQWCSGSGYSDFQTVQSDLSQLDTDSGNSDLAAVESDGSSLFQDAHAASQDPDFLPPVSNTHRVQYGLWVGFVMVAGAKAGNGDISGASSAIAQASKYTSTVQYISGQCEGTS